MKLNRGYKYRIYPTPTQRQIFASWFGSCRFVWNQLLPEAASTSAYDLKKRLPLLKRDYPWLADCPSQALQSSVLNLGQAVTRHRQRLGQAPKRKLRKQRQSLCIPQGVKLTAWCNPGDRYRSLKLPKLDTPVKLVLHRPFPGSVKSVNADPASPS